MNNEFIHHFLLCMLCALLAKESDEGLSKKCWIIAAVIWGLNLITDFLSLLM